MRVSEIWDSRQQFEALGERLMQMPVLADIPFDSGGPPEIFEAHTIRDANVVTSDAEPAHCLQSHDN